MQINKSVAQEELKILGGKPTVTKYWDIHEKKNIDIFKSDHVPQVGLQSCATIGLNKTDIGLISNGKSLRVEIVGVGDIKINHFQNIIATSAFNVMDTKKCFPGIILKNIVSQYIFKSDMQHILLTDPFLWEDMECIELENQYVAWLLAVPISEKEYMYARKYGVDVLECLFEEKEIDIFDLYRKSIL